MGPWFCQLEGGQFQDRANFVLGNIINEDKDALGIKKIVRKWSVLIPYEFDNFIFSYITHLNLSFAQLYIV